MMLATPAAATINHLLSRQPALCRRLAAHAGKTACIDTGIMTLNLSVAADGLLQSATDEKPNVTIRLKPADVPRMLAEMERAFSYVAIEGDADFAKAISDVAMGLRWEAEEDLAPFVGDIAAVRIVKTARAAMSTAKSNAHNLAENIAEYLLEENPTLLRPEAADRFAMEVAILRDDTERLAKRIALLERSAGSGA
jgi:ubiquinone biosynthesis protein UbiJ